MKTIKFLIITLALLTVTTGCGKQKEVDLNVEGIKSITELSTLTVYYHNVAVGDKAKGTGITSWGEAARKYWIEYDGEVNIGIDMDELEIEVEGSKVIITMPKAKVLSTNLSNEMKVYASDDNWFNKNKITAEDQTVAVAEAQSKMRTEVEKNESLFIQAEQRVQSILTSYIGQVSKLSGKEYVIEFKSK